jgi:hypothetical protein
VTNAEVSLAKPAALPVSAQALKAVQAGARIKGAIEAAAAKVGKAHKDAQAALAADKQNKALPSAALEKNFSDVVQAARASLPVAACVAAVEQPVAEAAKASALAALKKEGASERLNAVAVTEKAKADALTAVAPAAALNNLCTAS